MLQGLVNEQLSQGTGASEQGQRLHSVWVGLQKLDGVHQLEFSRVSGVNYRYMG